MGMRRGTVDRGTPASGRASTTGAPTLPVPPPGRDGTVVRARDSFLRDEPVPRGAVRQAILASWVRSREMRVDPARLDLGREADSYRESPLFRAARPLLDATAASMANEPMSLILCDHEGVVLDRRTGDSRLAQHLDRVWLAPGFSYAEHRVGTNGIGTALECRGPANVFGHEHYVERLEALACAAAPVRHPVSGRILGVVDLTGWRRDADWLMTTTAVMIARQIEQCLLDQASRHELTLLQDYLTASRRNQGAVMAVSDDILMLNDRARTLVDPGDQASLVAAAADTLAAGRAGQIVVDLPSGAVVRVLCRPIRSAGAGSGGVLLVHPVARAPHSRPPGHHHAAPPAAVVGSGTLWTRCVQAVDRQLHLREWTVLAGEPGSGRRTLLRAVHQTCRSTDHLRVLQAAEFDQEWLADLAAEIDEGASTLVLADVDLLPPDALREVVDLLEPHREATDADRTWVAATVAGRRPSPELSALLDLFPRTVDVPPLRHHVEDVPDLVRACIGRLTHGRDLVMSPEAMRVLTRYPWPGNVAQLDQVVRRLVARRRSGVIGPADLPAEVHATSRRVLSPLEAIECDAIVQALAAADGNKAEAGRLLGLSRATIYRKVREYGITVPPPEGERRAG
jgi:sigma-54 dependent transcriptional regulator, acetoin dehydrogenase operon transcriptional activator AcoR